MSSTSHLSRRADLRDAGGNGQGIFAWEPIEAGTTVAGFGGHVTHRHVEQLDVRRRTHAMQIDEDLFLVGPVDLGPADDVSHSCEPNAGLLGNVLVVAKESASMTQRVTPTTTTHSSASAARRAAADS